MVGLCRKGPRAATVLRSLRDGTVPTEIPPTRPSIFQHTVHNTHTDTMANIERTDVSGRERELHSKGRSLVIMGLGALLTRMGGMHALPVSSIRRALENKYLGIPTHLWNIRSSNPESGF